MNIPAIGPGAFGATDTRYSLSLGVIRTLSDFGSRLVAAVLAFHHGARFGGAVADTYGNDPFVWVSPFLWSHCHARSRPASFGRGTKAPFVRDKDAVFFLSRPPGYDDIVFDCVFVIRAVCSIASVEGTFRPTHPARHYHFDQARSRYHKASALTRIADGDLSFVPEPPMPLGQWIEEHVAPGKLTVADYFGMRKRKNVRIVTADANGLYDRLVNWTQRPGHSRHIQLAMPSLLAAVNPTFPAPGPIVWP